jgi:hypothetical protein
VIPDDLFEADTLGFSQLHVTLRVGWLVVPEICTPSARLVNKILISPPATAGSLSQGVLLPVLGSLGWVHAPASYALHLYKSVYSSRRMR